MWDQRTSINISASEGSQQIGGSHLSSVQDKKIFESNAGDSGYLSGQQYSSDNFDSETDCSRNSVPVVEKLPVVDFYRDSGAIVEEEDDDDNDDYTKDTKPDSMIVRNESMVGLSESMCGLNLKGAPINNLNNSRRTADESKQSKQSVNRPLWEICYVQDADGDT